MTAKKAHAPELSTDELNVLLRYFKLLLFVAPASDVERAALVRYLDERPEDLMDVLRALEAGIAQGEPTSLRRHAAAAPAETAHTLPVRSPEERRLTELLTRIDLDGGGRVSLTQAAALLEARALTEFVGVLEAHEEGMATNTASLRQALTALRDVRGAHLKPFTQRALRAIRTLDQRVTDLEAAATVRKQL